MHEVRITKWDSKSIIDDATNPNGSLALRLRKAGYALERHIVQSFGASGATGTKRGATKKQRHADRSKPGEPPHIDSARLKASITTNWTESGNGRAEVKSPVATTQADDGVSQPQTPVTVRVGTNVEYAVHLGLGTKHMAARPFIRPAWDVMLPQMKAIVQKGE